MTADQLTYRRGTTAATVGLVLQLALTVATALVGLWTQSPAIQAATWHMLGGVPIWIGLVLIYSQFESERRETLASEKLATQDAASAVLFGNLSDELQRARQRLASLLGYGLPIVSFLVAIYLIAAGIALLWRHVTLAAASDPGTVTTLAPGVNPVGLLFVAGGLAFVAFIAARWISGYTRVREWQLLRGGASYLMSCFVLTALIAAGAATAAVLDDTSLFRAISAAVPAVMLLVGAEILLTGLLSAYRPKRPGELPRPAFDSRVLGLLTTPESLGRVMGELINYQFGVEVSRSWLYRLLGRAVTPLTILGAAVLFALSTLVVVGPDEQAVVLRFGAVQGRPGVRASTSNCPGPSRRPPPTRLAGCCRSRFRAIRRAAGPTKTRFSGPRATTPSPAWAWSISRRRSTPGPTGPPQAAWHSCPPTWSCSTACAT